MILTEKESTDLIEKIEKIIISKGESHHKLKDLRNVLEKLFKILCKENINNDKLTTDKRIKYIFNTFPEYRDVRKEAEGLRTEFNDITHDDDFEIKVSEKDVLRCEKDLKNLIYNFAFNKNGEEENKGKLNKIEKIIPNTRQSKKLNTEEQKRNEYLNEKQYIRYCDPTVIFPPCSKCLIYSVFELIDKENNDIINLSTLMNILNNTNSELNHNCKSAEDFIKYLQSSGCKEYQIFYHKIRAAFCIVNINWIWSVIDCISIKTTTFGDSSGYVFKSLEKDYGKEAAIKMLSTLPEKYFSTGE